MGGTKVGKAALADLVKNLTLFSKKLLGGEFDQLILTHKDKAVLGLVPFKWLKSVNSKLEENAKTIHQLQDELNDKHKRESEAMLDKEITRAQQKLLDIREKFAFLEDLNDGDIIEITKNVEFLEIEAGEKIFSQGYGGRQVYYIISGGVEIVLKLQDRTIPLAQLPQGQIFGEMAPITHEPRSATALAQKPTKILCFEIDDDRLMGNPLQFALLYRNFVKILAGKLILANQNK